MWLRISNISIRQIEAGVLENPVNAGSGMTLNLYQRETRSAFWIVKNKKVNPEFLDSETGKAVSKSKWTDNMKAFAQSEIEKMPPHKGEVKITIVGWLFLILAFGTLGYIVYDGIQAPEKAEKFEQKMTEEATVREGDIYMGRIEVYKEKGNPLGMKGDFGFFKVVKIEGDSYHIAKSVEMSKTAKPKEQLNSTDFEQETITVKAKSLEAYHKTFVSEDGLLEISLMERKE